MHGRPALRFVQHRIAGNPGKTAVADGRSAPRGYGVGVERRIGLVGGDLQGQGQRRAVGQGETKYLAAGLRLRIRIARKVEPAIGLIVAGRGTLDRCRCTGVGCGGTREGCQQPQYEKRAGGRAGKACPMATGLVAGQPISPKPRPGSEHATKITYCRDRSLCGRSQKLDRVGVSVRGITQTEKWVRCRGNRAAPCRVFAAGQRLRLLLGRLDGF